MADTPLDRSATQSSSLLMGLAILKVNAERQQDTFLDNFFPFVVQGIVDLDDRVPTWIDISRAVYQRFHIKLPAGVVQHIIYRMQSRKQLTRNADGVIELASKLTETNRFKSQTKQFLKKHGRFLSEFISFCEQSGVNVSNQRAEDELLAFVEEHGVDLLSEEYGDVKESTSSPRQESSSDPRVHYLLPRFVQESIDHGSDHGEHVLNLVKGMWIASSLYEADENGDISKPFVNTTVYFDTKVLLRALGFAGKELQEATLPTIQLSSSANARTAVFEHTVDEIRGVLIATAKANLDPRHTDSLQEVNRWLLEADGVSVDDLLRSAGEVEDLLAQIGVQTDERPPPEPELTVDEIKLEATLQEAMPGLAQRALQKDLDSLTAIHRLRGGKALARLENCRAILSTTSSGLCRIARQEFGNKEVESVPLAIPDHHLQTITWLKHPLPSPDLPKQVVLAHCYSAIQPSEMLWSKYLTTIKRLSEQGTHDESDYLWLKYSRDAREALMNRTLGVSASLTEETLSEILDERYNTIKAPLEEELSRYRATLEEQQAQLASLLSKFDQQDARAHRAEESLREEQRARQDLEKKMKGAEKYSRRVRRDAAVANAKAPAMLESNPVEELPSPVNQSQDSPLRKVLNVLATLITVVLIVPLSLIGAGVIFGAVLSIMPDDTPGRFLLPSFAISTTGRPILLIVAGVLTLLSLLVGWNLRSSWAYARKAVIAWLAKQLDIDVSGPTQP